MNEEDCCPDIPNEDTLSIVPAEARRNERAELLKYMLYLPKVITYAMFPN